MSSWTYVSGQVTVAPSGSGKHAKRFVLEEVLDHLPRVYGSEGDMTWHVVERHGYDSSCNHDEFGMKTNLSERGWWDVQSEYIIVLEGRLRDTVYEDTLRSFAKWLGRLSKRVWVHDVLVRVSGYSRRRGSWNEYLFNGADHWRTNYWATPQIRFLSPDQVVVAAKNVRCDCQHDAIARTIHVVLSGDFDEYDVQNLL